MTGSDINFEKCGHFLSTIFAKLFLIKITMGMGNLNYIPHIFESLIAIHYVTSWPLPDVSLQAPEIAKAGMMTLTAAETE